MSSTTTKSLCLSQPKIGQVSEVHEVTLPYESEHTDTETVVKIEVPGVDPATIHIQCEHNMLHVSCERGALALPVDPTSDSSKITADIHWGLLTIRIPLPKPAPSHSIKLNVMDTPKKVPAKSAREGFTGED